MPGGGYPIISQTVERLEQDARVAEMLGGSKLAVHGVGDGHGRRRPVFKQSLMEDGRQTIDAVFYVQGARNRAKVTLQAVEVLTQPPSLTSRRQQMGRGMSGTWPSACLDSPRTS